MGYQTAMEAAGAVIHAYESFGDYQGSWYAKVTYNGETGWVEGSYGSCSGCDAFEAEFGWSYEDEPNVQERLAEFGRSYLTVVTPQEQQVAFFERQLAENNSSWYEDEYRQILEFVKANG
jgi:hypothetical protein